MTKKKINPEAGVEVISLVTGDRGQIVDILDKRKRVKIIWGVGDDETTEIVAYDNLLALTRPIAGVVMYSRAGSMLSGQAEWATSKVVRRRAGIC